MAADAHLSTLPPPPCARSHVIIAGFGRVGELIGQARTALNLHPHPHLHLALAKPVDAPSLSPTAALSSPSTLPPLTPPRRCSPSASSPLWPSTCPRAACRRARSLISPCTLETRAPPPCCTPWAPTRPRARCVLPSLRRVCPPSIAAAFEAVLEPFSPCPFSLHAVLPFHPPSHPHHATQVITLDTAGANYRSVWAMHKHFPQIKTFVRAFDVESGALQFGSSARHTLPAAAAALVSSCAAPDRHSSPPSAD